MPSLDFKGKQFVYAHHLSVPFRQLDIDKKKSLPKDGKPSLDDNLIIHGDNLHALKALLPKYAGKVKCIYIDPPYNTGNEGWCYNDNVNAPLIKEWLKDTANPVDKEDLERHDKWLCMMWPRLQLLRELLAEDGVIFVSIDEKEHHSLRHILDEIFYEENFIAEFVWHSSGHSDNQYDVKINHEYVLAYAKNSEDCVLGNVVDPNTREESNLWKGFAENSITKNGPKNPPSIIDLPQGFPCKVQEINLEASDLPKEYFSKVESLGYISRDLTREYGAVYPVRMEEMNVKNGVLTKSCKVYTGWANAKKLRAFIENDCQPILEKNGDSISFYLSENGVVYYKRERQEAKHILSVLINFKTTEKMRSQLEDIGIKFQYPKPDDLISYLIKVAGTQDDDIVLDSFSGSGSTAHAVLNLNKEDSGNRKFILVEMEDYANDITAERVRRVIGGVPDAKDDALKEGLGGSFTFCDLGQEINIENLLKGEKLPEYDELARYAFYTATGLTLDDVKQGTDYFIGETENYRVHLIYKPDLAFLRSGESALNMPLAKSISAARENTGKSALVFATHKFMGQKELTDMGITYCQLPYAIHRVMGD